MINTRRTALRSAAASQAASALLRAVAITAFAGAVAVVIVLPILRSLVLLLHGPGAPS